ncbi:helix-turn-helix domain-containing protein [Lapidilactobacillus salsurivasis]
MRPSTSQTPAGKNRKPITDKKLDLAPSTGTIIGQNIRRLRKSKGMTQRELADKLNTIEQTISKMERGIFSPSTESLMQLCAVFNVTPNDLMLDMSVVENIRANALDDQDNSLQSLTKQMLPVQQLFAKADIARDAHDEGAEAEALDQIIKTYTPRLSDRRRVAEWLHSQYIASSLKLMDSQVRDCLIKLELE